MGLLGKLFDHSRVPEQLRAQFDAEGLIYLAEKIGVTLSFSGSVPGLYSSASRSRGNGMLAFTRQPLTDDVLAQAPARSLRFSVPPECVFHILGVRVKN
ncbi:hypothetical protein BH09ACT8_BH09ACT8_56430 [soil metagenome]